MIGDDASTQATGPARPATEIEELHRSIVPPPFAQRLVGRGKRRLGDAFGLTQYGVNLTALQPGAQSALRHWHSHEDEFIYVLSGELVLVTDRGEQTVSPGMVAGFPAGSTDAHYLVNRSDQAASFLEIGSRNPSDIASYPDDDLAWQRIDGQLRAHHKDGRSY